MDCCLSVLIISLTFFNTVFEQLLEKKHVQLIKNVSVHFTVFLCCVYCDIMREVGSAHLLLYPPECKYLFFFFFFFLGLFQLAMRCPEAGLLLQFVLFVKVFLPWK